MDRINEAIKNVQIPSFTAYLGKNACPAEEVISALEAAKELFEFRIIDDQSAEAEEAEKLVQSIEDWKLLHDLKFVTEDDGENERIGIELMTIKGDLHKVPEHLQQYLLFDAYAEDCFAKGEAYSVGGFIFLH